LQRPQTKQDQRKQEPNDQTKNFFDTRDGPELLRDEEGVELDGIQQARDEATRALVDLVRDLIPGSESRELAIEVRDRRNVPLLKAALSFKIAVLAG
jgi:hypothetical protein